MLTAEQEAAQMEVIRKLGKENEDYTWNFYKRLEEESKLSDDLLKMVQFAREEKSALKRSYQDLMPYFFVPNYDPYSSFRANRYMENGELIPFNGDDDELPCGYAWSLEKEAQYMDLETKLLAELNFEHDWTDKAKKIADDPKFGLLWDYDKEMCFELLFLVNRSHKHFDEVCSYHHHLLRKDVLDKYRMVLEGDTDDFTKFVDELQKSVKFSGPLSRLHCGLHESGIEFVYHNAEHGLFTEELRKINVDHQRKGELPFKKAKLEVVQPVKMVEEMELTKKIDKMKKIIDENCAKKKYDVAKRTLLGNYLKVKRQMAEDVGLIYLDEKGCYVDRFRDIFYPPEEDQCYAQDDLCYQDNMILNG